MTTPVAPIKRVILYKHGVGYFEREANVHDAATLALTFRQQEVSDVLKSLTVLDLDGGHVSSISYDSTKPIEQLLADVAFTIPNQNSLFELLPQLKGTRIAITYLPAELLMAAEDAMVDEEEDEEFEDFSEGNGNGNGDGNGHDHDFDDEQDDDEDAGPAAAAIEGLLLGLDPLNQVRPEGTTKTMLLSILTDDGAIFSWPIDRLASVRILDERVRKDLEFYLRTQLSATKKEARTFTFFAEGKGPRSIRISYVLEAPVWKATYRILIGDESTPHRIQGWAVVDNTLDEDWDGVELSLVAGLPVSFTHDLYTPRYLKRPVIAVAETAGVTPPVVEEGIAQVFYDEPLGEQTAGGKLRKSADCAALGAVRAPRVAAPSSTPAQIRERKLGDLFAYDIEHPVTIRRNQSALVPIVLKDFQGQTVLLHNRQTRTQNPMRCVEFENVTGLTLEGGPANVLERGDYVGEAMLETTKPDEKRLIPFAVELSVHVLDNVRSFKDRVRKVILRNGVVQMESVQVEQTVYEFNNKGTEKYVLYLDHPRSHGRWKLTETPEPVETTENFWRFKLALPPKAVTSYTVRAQLVEVARQNFNSLNGNHLQLWIEQKYLDAKATKLLKDVLAGFQSINEVDARKTRLAKERETIHQEQTRIRGNLDSLGDRASEKELRERFVRSLGTQEDRLEAIHKELSGLDDQKAELQRKLDGTIAKIDYEADVSG